MQPVVAQTEWSNGLHKVTFTLSEMIHFGDGGGGSKGAEDGTKLPCTR